ncbi:MAG: FAD:protein FMN transferase [Akkermansiaceae bacterium]
MSKQLPEGLFRLSFKALGTQCEVQFQAPSIEAAKNFRKEALEWLRDFENRWSRFKPDSFLSEINQQAGRDPIPYQEDDREIFQLCEYVHKLSRGLNDPTSLPLTSLWDQAGRLDRLPDESKIKEAQRLVSWPEVEWANGTIRLPEPGMALEIGGFGKEFAVDRLIKLAQKNDIIDCLVDLGRDVAAVGKPPHGETWIIGIEDARMEDSSAYRLALSNRGLATSGNGRRFRIIGSKKFGHILDLRSGYPAVNEILTVSALANDCLTAGQISTTTCILGLEEGIDLVENTHGIEAILQTSGHTRYSSRIHQHVLAS